MNFRYGATTNGQYNVELTLGGRYEELDLLQKEVATSQEVVPSIISLKNDVLQYKSETLLPNSPDSNKQKILFIFGNPAVHSVVKKMFFFAREDGHRHNMWGKIAKANLMQPVISN